MVSYELLSLINVFTVNNRDQTEIRESAGL